MSERSEEIVRLAKQVAEDSIVTQALERLIYQIVEACAEHEQEALAAARREERDNACAALWRVCDQIGASTGSSIRIALNSLPR